MKARPPIQYLVASLALLLCGGFGAPALAQDRCTGVNLLERLAKDDPARHAAILARGAEIESGVGNFWKVEKPGIAPSYLFGTAHVSDDRALRFLATIADALRGSRILLVELDPTQQSPQVMAAAVADHALLPEGRTLDAWLSEEQAERLGAETARHGMPWFQARKYRSGLLATLLSIPPCAKMALLRGEPVLDMQIIDIAAGAGVTVRGLETAAEQMAAIAALDETLMLDAILESLSLGPGFAEDIYETTLALYAEERISLVNPLIDVLSDDLPLGRQAAAQMQTVLVGPRNHLMAERARPHIEKGGAFVAVGALHLPGADGLVALFEAAGFTVTRLTPSP